MSDSVYTPTQRRLLNVLKDGEPHKRAELASYLNDDMAGRGTLKQHLTNMRKILRPKGLEIICELHQGRFIAYRLVRRVSPNDE